MNLHTIPNNLIAAVGLGFFAYAMLTGMSTDLVIWRAQLAIVVFAVGFVAFGFGVIGAGSAKLIAVAFLWLGFAAGSVFLAVSMLLSAAGGFVMNRVAPDKRGVPYLPFAALTAVLMMLGGGMPSSDPGDASSDRGEAQSTRQ